MLAKFRVREGNTQFCQHEDVGEHVLDGRVG